MEEKRVERAVTAGVLVVAAVIGFALVSGGPAPTGAEDTFDRLTRFVEVEPASTAASGVPTSTTTTATVAATTTTVDPGTLPQTDERPIASGATFDAGVQGLWQAIQQDRPELALPFFFPEAAYLQVKAIPGPAADYQQRLIVNYEQDIHTLHAQLGADAASAQLAGIDVPDAEAVLVQPGEESNQLPYWRVYGTMLHSTLNGETTSMPVTSLISWRGQWYVVHLGEIR